MLYAHVLSEPLKRPVKVEAASPVPSHTAFNLVPDEVFTYTSTLLFVAPLVLTSRGTSVIQTGIGEKNKLVLLPFRNFRKENTK
jgi:hypothetical protein